MVIVNFRDEQDFAIRYGHSSDHEVAIAAVDQQWCRWRRERKRIAEPRDHLLGKAARTQVSEPPAEVVVCSRGPVLGRSASVEQNESFAPLLDERLHPRPRALQARKVLRVAVRLNEMRPQLIEHLPLSFGIAAPRTIE